MRKFYTKVMKNKRFCYDYWRPAVTTDCVIFGYDPREGLSLLLIERGVEPFKGKWAFPGGFLQENETVEECAARELKEETGFVAGKIEQFGCFSDVNRNPRKRVITIAFYALVKMSLVQGGDDAMNAKWYKLSEIPALAFDHDHILHVALSRLKEEIHFEPIGFELLPCVLSKIILGI